MRPLVVVVVVPGRQGEISFCGVAPGVDCSERFRSAINRAKNHLKPPRSLVTVTMVRAAELGSTFVSIDPSDTKDLQLYLSEIGARLSDVFGADNILWVEGKN